MGRCLAVALGATVLILLCRCTVSLVLAVCLIELAMLLGRLLGVVGTPLAQLVGLLSPLLL